MCCFSLTGMAYTYVAIDLYALVLQIAYVSLIGSIV